MPNSWQCRALALLGALTIIFLLWPICCCAAKPTHSDPRLNTNSIPIQYSPPTISSSTTTTTTTLLTDISTIINNSKEQKLVQSEIIKSTTNMNLEHNLISYHSSSEEEQNENMGYDKIKVISDSKNGTKFDFFNTSNSNKYSRNKLKLQLSNDKNINHHNNNDDDVDVDNINDVKLTLLQDNTILTPSNTFLISTTTTSSSTTPTTTSVNEIFNFTASPPKSDVLQRSDRSVKNINNNNTSTNVKRNKHNSNNTKISHLDRNERSANLSHITGGARKIQLYIKNRFLQLLPDGTINGTTDDLSDFSKYQNTMCDLYHILGLLTHSLMKTKMSFV